MYTCRSRYHKRTQQTTGKLAGILSVCWKLSDGTDWQWERGWDACVIHWFHILTRRHPGELASPFPTSAPRPTLSTNFPSPLNRLRFDKPTVTCQFNRYCFVFLFNLLDSRRWWAVTKDEEQTVTEHRARKLFRSPDAKRRWGERAEKEELKGRVGVYRLSCHCR